MRSMLAANWVLVGAMVVAIGFPARGEAGCRTAQEVCDLYPPMLGLDCPVSMFVEGEHWTAGARGGEIVLSLTAGAGAIEASHEGTITNISCAEDSIFNLPPEVPGGLTESILVMPTSGAIVGHCAVSLETRHHYYLWFMADIPDIPDTTEVDEGCHGWTECRCIDVDDEDDDDDQGDHHANRGHPHH